MVDVRAMDGEAKLRRMQYLALGCLGAAAALFIVTIFLPPTFAVRLIKAGAEAAMVGGLADWFAVVALFRHPMGLRIPHTAIIPKGKDRIAENLADFVREKFLNPQVLTELIQRSDPIRRFATWLEKPANARRVGRHAANLTSAWLDLVDEKSIQSFIGDAARAVLGKLDLSQALGSVLTMLTKGGRHQQLLDGALEQLTQALRKPAVREKVAAFVVTWLKKEHKIKQMVLPTEWIGEQAADAAQKGLENFLSEVANSPTHDLRKTFDDALKSLAQKLKDDGEFRRKGEEIKEWIQNNPEMGEYTRSLWKALRDWLSEDLESGAPQVQQQIERIGLWLGKKISADDELRASINGHIESLASNAAPQFADFLTRHISDTVRKWDAQAMSRQIEVSIGPDLQYIRISGTVVGFVIGLVLFLVAQAPGVAH
ncbi:DUF445 domain-containing protein [Variovorax paradoxus]|uniref:DUF445 domain-containing protein n=1 Tax=Variovorax paradoxus TaxID=34073 RepID=UPI003ED0A0F6